MNVKLRRKADRKTNSSIHQSLKTTTMFGLNSIHMSSNTPSSECLATVGADSAIGLRSIIAGVTGKYFQGTCLHRVSSAKA